jgi:hypothetical protein
VPTSGAMHASFSGAGPGTGYVSSPRRDRRGVPSRACAWQATPCDMPELTLRAGGMLLSDVLTSDALPFSRSCGEALRPVKHGGVKIDAARQHDEKSALALVCEERLRTCKRRYAKLAQSPPIGIRSRKRELTSPRFAARLADSPAVG